MRPQRKKRNAAFLALGLTLVSGFTLIVSQYSFAQSKTIVDEWASVQAPKPPELKSVKIDDPKTTAFLVLDIIKQGCNSERRPRCVASVPKIQAFLNQARTKGVSVVHSYTSTSTPADILKEVAPLPGEPLVQAPADKFFRTDLEKIFKIRGSRP